MLRCFAVLSLLLSVRLSGQNLVADSSFESALNHGDSSWVSPPGIDSNLTNWFTYLSKGDARYYHADVPRYLCYTCPGKQTLKYRGARSGSAYVDVAVSSVQRDSADGKAHLRFNGTLLYSKLTEPLTKGAIYKVVMFVRLDSSCAYAQDRISFAFTKFIDSASIDTLTFGSLSAIHKGETVCLDATNEWTMITGTFTATGGERFLLLGGTARGTKMKFVGRKLRYYERTPEQAENEKGMEISDGIYLGNGTSVVDPNGNGSVIYHIDDVSVTQIAK